MRKTKEDYIGMTKMMNCGLNATIIAYRNSKDIDIQFENGTVRKHVCTGSFRKGEISEKIFTTTRYIGQTKMMNYGLNATIIAYRKFNDIDVQFETGTVRKHVNICNFTRRKITYPEAKLFGIYTIQKKAFVFHNKTYFCVSYTKNKAEMMDIMSVDDMKNRMNEIS